MSVRKKKCQKVGGNVRDTMYPSIIDHCHCIYHPQLLQMDVGKVTIMLNIDRYCEFVCGRKG